MKRTLRATAPDSITPNRKKQYDLVAVQSLAGVQARSAARAKGAPSLRIREKLKSSFHGCCLRNETIRLVQPVDKLWVDFDTCHEALRLNCRILAMTSCKCIPRSWCSVKNVKSPCCLVSKKTRKAEMGSSPPAVLLDELDLHQTLRRCEPLSFKE